MASLKDWLQSMIRWSLMLKHCTHWKLERLMVTSSGTKAYIHLLITVKWYFGVVCKQVTPLSLPLSTYIQKLNVKQHIKTLRTPVVIAVSLLLANWLIISSNVVIVFLKNNENVCIVQYYSTEIFFFCWYRMINEQKIVKKCVDKCNFLQQ